MYRYDQDELTLRYPQVRFAIQAIIFIMIPLIPYLMFRVWWLSGDYHYIILLNLLVIPIVGAGFVWGRLVSLSLSLYSFLIFAIFVVYGVLGVPEFPTKYLLLSFFSSVFLVALGYYAGEIVLIFEQKQALFTLNQKDIEEEITSMKEEVEQTAGKLEYFKEKKESFNHYQQLIKKLNNEFDFEKQLEIICETCVEIFGGGKAIIYRYRDRGLVPIKVSGRREPANFSGEDYNFYFLEWRRNLFIENTHRDSRIVPKKNVERDVRSVIGSPIMDQKKMWGVLRMESEMEGTFELSDLRMLDFIAGLVAMSLKNTELYAETVRLARTDDLTGLAKRWFFEERLKEEINGNKVKEKLGLIITDIDHFKRFNDNYGHAVGDQVLSRVSKRLMDIAPKPALCARYGGEEFCILVSATSKEKLKQLALQINETIEEEAIKVRGESVGVTVSLGCALWPEDAKTADQLVKQADKALYRAKSGGRNRVEVSWA